ncbi:MAG: hypothetical protein ACRC32_12610 [Chroococcidiopsis sp.]
MQRFIADGAAGKKWFNGVVYFFEFESEGRHYISASRSDCFETSIAIELIPGQELNQIRELEELIISD